MVLYKVKEWDKYCLRRHKNGNIFYNSPAIGIDTILLKPILISSTEKIERNDKYFCNEGIQTRFETDYHYGEQYKVLALSEHFSSQQLQDIVDGKLKDGDRVLVECEAIRMGGVYDTQTWTDYFIKLNSSNHITLHKVEEKMYTESTIIGALSEYRFYIDKSLGKEEKVLSAKEWFEQNVK